MVFTVAHTFEGIEESSGEAQFLAEEVDGTLVGQMRVVEHGKVAEMSTMARGTARGVGGAIRRRVRTGG